MIDQAGGQVDLLVTDTDRYGRLIAEVYAGETFTQAVLVGEGLAWNYRQFYQNCPSADRINPVEAEARSAGVGVTWNRGSGGGGNGVCDQAIKYTPSHQTWGICLGWRLAP